LSKEWDPKWGGGLQLWSHNYDTNKPDKKITTIDVKFNRAIIFDTTQHSWHGFPDPLECPENIYRKSIAMYYLCEPSENIDKRKRALYAPSNDQLDNKEILDLIIKRSI
jgi:Rps23 Pro-64 3,4-dihydroxylase Tpa1-like proline 4-hydroxylase